MTDIDTRAAELRALMLKHLGVKGHDFADALKRAGRRLPGKIRTEAQAIAQAQEQMRHPKLRIRLDGARVDAAFRTVREHLKSQDLADRRRGRMLSFLGTIAFNVIIVAGMFVFWLWWRDYI